VQWPPVSIAVDANVNPFRAVIKASTQVVVVAEAAIYGAEDPAAANAIREVLDNA
jgi:hypothetical protein